MRSSPGLQKRNLLPPLDHFGLELHVHNVSSEAAVVCEDSAISHSDGCVRSDAFTPSIVGSDAQVDRPGALERSMPPLAEMP